MSGNIFYKLSGSAFHYVVGFLQLVKR